MKYLNIFFLIFISSQANAGEFILKLKPQSSFSLLQANPFRVLDVNRKASLYKIQISDEAAIFLKRNYPQDVEYLIPNIPIQIEERPLEIYGEVANLAQSQWNLAKVKTEEAWRLAGNRGSKKITVAVIDSGVDATHPDLKGNVIQGYNFMDGSTNTSDGFGHGTHCAGVIGATGAVSVSGISPVVQILPLKFLNERGLGDLYNGIKAIDYAIEKKVDIISASWGAQISLPELAQALKEAGERADQAGVLLVAAAGNFNRDNDALPYFPANANTPSILSVAATDANDVKIKISNFGQNKVQIAAPGEKVISTYLKGKYATFTGTSMATPLVAGLAAFIKAQNPQLTAKQIREIILNNGAPAQVENLCHCRIDAEAATRFTLGLSKF